MNNFAKIIDDGNMKNRDMKIFEFKNIDLINNSFNSINTNICVKYNSYDSRPI